MSRNGSGVYNLVTNSWNPATNGVSATAADWQSLINDVASALTQSVSADGQTPITGSLNMGGNRLTNLAAGIATGQSLRFEQLFDQGVEQDVASAATTDIGIQNSNFIRITGTTTITSFGTNYRGPRFVRFGGVLTLTHNATTLILPSSANITTAAGDRAIVAPIGNPASGWQVVAYVRASGQALIGPDLSAYALLAGATFTGPVTIPTLTNTSLTSASLNGGQFAGIRNKIINGAMAVDQRNIGAAQTITAGAALAYTVDRWYAYCTGANVTGQRVAGTAPNQFNYRFTGAASVTKIGFAQRIEAANSQDLAGQTATLSVDLANSVLTTVTWTAWYANSSDSFGTIASPTRTQIATGTFTVSGTLTRYNAQISIPSAATTGIEVEFSVGAQTSGTWTIGRAQLELGSVATPFEYRLIGQELAFCQRYLPSFKADAANDVICPIAAQTSTTGYPIFPFYVEPRVSPTGVTISNVTHFSAFNTAGGVTALTNLTLSSASKKQGSLFATVGAASFTAGGGSFLAANTTSAQLLFTGCEL